VGAVRLGTWGGEGKGYPIGGVMVFNATFYNISAISWWSVLLVEQTKVPGEGQTLLLNAILSKLCHERNFNSDFKS
jgi:hypothetical protein